MTEWKARTLSIVVPVFNEEDNARPLVERIAQAVRPLEVPFEVVIVDDGSSDRTGAILRELVDEIPELVFVDLRRNFGQTLALQAGLDRARGDAIVTMDGDLQNDPADIPQLLVELEAGADVVSGWRVDRQDTLFVRKVPSWIANRLIRLVTGVQIHDQGCALKAYRREVVQALDLYADLHRFIAILTMGLGARISEVEVRHHARVAGVSKYGLSRTFKVLADLFSIQMLTWFRENPLHWFAMMGSPFLAVSVLTGIGALFNSGIVLPTVTVLTATTFVTCVLFGVVGESVIESAGHDRERPILFREWKGRMDV